jgi:hypothetical protein
LEEHIIFFNPEDGGDMFFQNVGWLLTGYMAISQMIVFKPLL